MARTFTVKNNSGGPRYFHASVGTVTLQPEEVSRPLELTDDDRTAISDRGEFEIAEAEAADEPKALSRMKKDELIGEANHRGIAGFTADDGTTKPLAELTKDELVRAIERHDEESAKV